MEALLDYVSTFKSIWVVWLMGLFLVIVVRACWPGRREEMDYYANIPLQDDETGAALKDNHHAH